MLHKCGALFLIATSLLSAQNNKLLIEDRVAQKVKPFMEKYKVPGAAVILFIDGKPYQFYYGYADRETKALVTAQTLFELGSISKIFTVLLLAQEVLAGHMRLEDPISLYIPELQANKFLKHMTLEKLATHTADLPFNAPDWVKNERDLIEHIKPWKPTHQEPVWWKYSNHGFELIRIALERYTGKSFNELLIARILKPLGMAPIGVVVPPALQKYYASCYDKIGNKSIAWNDGYLIGSAAVKVSGNDMQQFLKAALGLPGVPLSILNAMRLSQLPYIAVEPINHGLAWEITDLANKEKIFDWPVGTPAALIPHDKRILDPNALYEKGGTTNGFHAYVGIIPNKKNGICIMINKRRYDGWKVLKKLGREILLEGEQ